MERDSRGGSGNRVVLYARHSMRWLLLCCSLGCLSGCATSPSLVVDVYTDFEPQTEFDEVTISVGPLDGRSSLLSRYAAPGSAAYIPRPERFTPDLPEAGPIEVEVRLERGGARIASRRVRLTLRESAVLSVYLLRRCAEVTCPMAGAPTRTECDDGRCVEPECTDPRICSTPSCEVDADCPMPAAACATATCVDARCAFVPRSGSCDAAERCDPSIGCVPRAPRDAGVPDAGPRDAGTDARLPSDAGTDARRDCTTDTECPADEATAFSGCAFTDICAESGADESRMVTDWSCDGSGRCVSTMRTETRACARDTDGTSCGTTIDGVPGPCRYTDGCVELGVQDVPVTTFVCQAGACRSMVTSIPLGCSRDTDGTVCGGEHDACVAGSCTTMSTPSNCGAYGVACAPGDACVPIATGGGTHWGCSTIATANCTGLSSATDSPRSGAASFMSACHCSCNTRSEGAFDVAPFDQVCATILTGAQAGADVCGVGVCHETTVGSWNYCAMY